MKKKKWLLALTAAMTGVLVLGLVGCGGGGDDESSDEHGGKNPEEIRREQIETLTGGVFSKADDALLMDSVHYSIRTGNPGNWDTVHLEKGANGFCFYQQNYVSDAKTASIDSFSDEITYLTGVELSEETKSIVKNFNPYYFFTKDGSYYLQNKNGATGEIAQSVYEEVLAYVNAFTSNSLSALFNAENFEISEHGTQLLQKQEGELTVNGKAVTEAEWGFGLQEPTFELKMYVGGRFYEMIADYPVGVQEFVDYYMSEVFGDTEGVTTDGFGAKTEELTARQAQSEEFQITLPTYLYKTVEKIAAGNYRVKVTSTEKFYENFSDSTIATREYEYLYDNGNIKRTAGQEEIYFNTETKYTVETLGAKKIGYTAGETFAADFEKAAKFYTESFMEYLSNTVVVNNLPTYNADKECFTKQWFYNSSLFGGLQGYPQVELTFDADKLVLNLKVADSSYSSQYKHFYTFEFDSFGQVDVEMPQVEQASVKDILDEIIATDTYNLISGNYPSVVENGQGAVSLPGEYNTTRLKADGEKYYAHTGEYNARKKYEITQDMYQSFLPRSSYVYGELFDYDNYTASGDGYAYSDKNFDGTATVDGDKIVLTITQNRVSGLVDCQTITLSHNLQDKAYAQENGTAQDLPSLTDTEFLQILNKQDRKFEMSCQKDGSEWSEYRRYHFEGNNLAIQRGHVSSYYQVDGDDVYGIHSAGNYRIVKYKENDALDGFNSAKQNCAAALLGERTYITLNSFVCETDDGWVKISKSTYSGLVSYGFVFADGLNVNLNETTSNVSKYKPTHYAKTVAEIQADFASKNYTYADGTATYQVDGENLAQTVAKGYHYYIKGDSGYTKYVKELNANGVFTLTSESTANAVDIVTELVAMANGNLTMTEEGVAIPAWFEWKNDNVTGVDGVNSVAIAIALDGTYTITINDGERVITLSQMGEADVSAPSDDKMTLFAESLAYQNNFTWTVKAIGSQMYESMPEVSALAGATLISATKKADGKKLSYSLTTNNPLANQSAIQTDLRANLNGDSSKLYRYDYTQSQWLGSTRTESFIHSAIAGMQAADIAELLDVNKYTLENGTYTLKSEYTFQWKYDYNWINDTVISTELMDVKVVVNEDSLVLTATARIDEKYMVDVTYTFNGLGSTSVTIPTV